MNGTVSNKKSDDIVKKQKKQIPFKERKKYINFYILNKIYNANHLIERCPLWFCLALHDRLFLFL